VENNKSINLEMSAEALKALMKHEGYAGSPGARLSEWNPEKIKTNSSGTVLRGRDKKGKHRGNPKNMKWGDSDYGAYFDSKGFLTTGHGHLISKAAIGSNQFWKDVDRHEKSMNVPDVMNLSKEEAAREFSKDARTHGSDKINRMITNKEGLNQELIDALSTEAFRGSIKAKHKTVKLINEGKFEEAASEYLDNAEYRNTRSSGIKERMNDVAIALLNEAKKRKKQKQADFISQLLNSGM